MSAENDLIEKIIEWQTKANSENDPFDKYVSIFIAYNIFYNLYEKKKTGVFEDFVFGDSRRAIRTIELVEPHQLFSVIFSDLAEYLHIIPVFNEEYWPQRILKNGTAGMPISATLERAYSSRDEKQCVELLLKWLYKVRCNLVHGAKSYKDDHQKVLLIQSSKLLDRILTHMVENYKRRFP